MSSHFPNHAFACASSVALIKQGRLVGFGPPERVSPSPVWRRFYGILRYGFCRVTRHRPSLAGMALARASLGSLCMQEGGVILAQVLLTRRDY